MKCYKCNYANRSDAVYCQQCGTLMRQRPQKVLVLRRSPSLARRCQVASYYFGYALCVLIGGGVLAAGAFLLFLVLCDWLGVTDSAGNSSALLVLVTCEIGVLSIYGVLVVRIVKARMSEALHHLPSYRREPSARR
jgi:hypothetical protein